MLIMETYYFILSLSLSSFDLTEKLYICNCLATLDTLQLMFLIASLFSLMFTLKPDMLARWYQFLKISNQPVYSVDD